MVIYDYPVEIEAIEATNKAIEATATLVEEEPPTNDVVFDLNDLPPTKDERWYNFALRLNKCVFKEPKALQDTPFIVHAPCLQRVLSGYITFEEDLLSNFQFP